jgi:hypothetical protein
MSNAYKEWIWDSIQEEVLAQGLMDIIISVWPQPHEGTPCYVKGLKDEKDITYYVTLTDEGWLCRHQEI